MNLTEKQLLKLFKGKSHDEIIDLANELTAPIRTKLKEAKTPDEKAVFRNESKRIANFAVRVANGSPNGKLHNWPDGKDIPDYMEIIDGWVMPDHISPFFPGIEHTSMGCFYTIEDMYWNLYTNSYEND